jgi:tetratricopeptide (TPR) repeat protein
MVNDYDRGLLHATRRGLIVATVTLAALVSGLPVVAEQSDDDRARELFQVGIDAFESEDYGAALAAFELSYQLNPVSSVLYNIAMCHRALVRYVESIQDFERYLEEGGDRIAAERRQEVEGLVLEMERLVGRIEMDVSPPEADVEIDGVPVERGVYASSRVRAGAHTVRASCPGYRDAVRRVEMAPGEVARVEVALEREVQRPGEPPDRERSRRRSLRAALWVVLGLTAASAVAFAATAAMGADRMNGLGPDPSSDDIAEAETLANASYGLAGTTGVLGMTAIVLAVVEAAGAQNDAE